MANLVSGTNERKYFVDWLRIILILSVFLFHIGMIFNNWDWHIKNDITSEHKSILWYIMIFLGKWRMPLLILISGGGTYLALGSRSGKQYLGERFKRLFIPLTAGIFILVPIQVYIERIDEYSSLLAYYPQMFEGVYPSGNFSWHHLWFIAYLFFISLLISPFISFLKSTRFDAMVGRIAALVNKPLGANIFLIPLCLSQLLLRPHFPDNTHAFFNDWAAISYYIIYFISGYIIISSPKILEAIKRQKHYFLLQAAIGTAAMFTIPGLIENGFYSGMAWFSSETIMAWSMSISVMGYAQKHLNFNSKIRKYANEAIYPFYLLHQPIIIVTAALVVPMELNVWLKVLWITTVSFSLTIAIYWGLIKRFNLTRILFGLKPQKSNKKEQQEQLTAIPVPVNKDNRPGLHD